MRYGRMGSPLPRNQLGTFKLTLTVLAPQPAGGGPFSSSTGAFPPLSHSVGTRLSINQSSPRSLFVCCTFGRNIWCTRVGLYRTDDLRTAIVIKKRRKMRWIKGKSFVRKKKIVREYYYNIIGACRACRRYYYIARRTVTPSPGSERTGESPSACTRS